MYLSFSTYFNLTHQIFKFVIHTYKMYVKHQLYKRKCNPCLALGVLYDSWWCLRKPLFLPHYRLIPINSYYI